MATSLTALPGELVILTVDVGRLQIADGLALRVTSKHLYEASECYTFWLCLARNNDSLPVPLYHPLNSFSFQELQDLCIRHHLSLKNISSEEPQYRRHRVIPFEDEDDQNVVMVAFLPGGLHIIIVTWLGDVELWNLSVGSELDSEAEDDEEPLERVGNPVARYRTEFMWWSGITIRALGNMGTGFALELRGQLDGTAVWTQNVFSFEDLHLDDVKTFEHCILPLPHQWGANEEGPGHHNVAMNDTFLAISNVADLADTVVPLKLSLVNWRSKQMVTVDTTEAFVATAAPGVILSEEGNVALYRNDGTSLHFYIWFDLVPHLREIPPTDEYNVNTDVQVPPYAMTTYSYDFLTTFPNPQLLDGLPRFLSPFFGGQVLLLADGDLGTSPVTETTRCFDVSKLFHAWREGRMDQDQSGVIQRPAGEERYSSSEYGYLETRRGTLYQTRGNPEDSTIRITTLGGPVVHGNHSSSGLQGHPIVIKSPLGSEYTGPQFCMDSASLLLIGKSENVLHLFEY